VNNGPVSPAAKRMRRHRERKRNRMRCLMIELRETEIAALIRFGLLRSDVRHDSRSVRDALYAYLEHTLGRIK
jgi:hypothetical protein